MPQKWKEDVPLKWIDGKVQKTWKCQWNSRNCSTCKNNVIKFYPVQWHFNFLTFCVSIHFIGTSSIQFCYTRSVHPFHSDQNSLKKIRIEIWTFSYEICLRNPFLTSGNGQTENMRMRICIVSVWPLPKDKNWFWKQIWNENIHITFLKKNLSILVSIWKSQKIDFPLYFQKVMLLWQGSIVEIDFGFFIFFGPCLIEKSLGTFTILIFGLWSFIPHP